MKSRLVQNTRIIFSYLLIIFLLPISYSSGMALSQSQPPFVSSGSGDLQSTPLIGGMNLEETQGPLQEQPPVLSVEDESNQIQNPADPVFGTPSQEELNEVTAVVLVRTASGVNYLDERQKILEMPELTTSDEIDEFIKRLEPLPAEMDRVQEKFLALGFNIVARDNVFLIVTGAPSAFQKITTDEAIQKTVSGVATDEVVICKNSIDPSFNTEDLIDGIIISPNRNDPEYEKELELLWQDVEGQLSEQDLAATYEPSYQELKKALTVDHSHDWGKEGVRVFLGMIDDGVLNGHLYFRENKTRFNHYYLKKGVPTPGLYNYRLGTAHGTIVASYLESIATKSYLYSFARTPFTTNTNKDILTYLTYINQKDILNILTIGVGNPERYARNIPEIRTQVINFIRRDGIILAAAGDVKLGIASNNSIAAIPEVIAVGGANMVPQMSTYIFEASPNATSFRSTIFYNRSVPDVTGIVGPSLLLPKESDGYRQGVGDTGIASAQVAGMLALLKSDLIRTRQSLNQSQAKNVLMNDRFDITDGRSGTGDYAGPGNDLATGYGLPLAHMVTASKQALYSGWNLITIPYNYEFTTRSFLLHIQRQGARCDQLARWNTGYGMYEYFIIDLDTGQEYGRDVPLRKTDGLFIRCFTTLTHGNFYWDLVGAPFIGYMVWHEFKPGVNVIGIPYAGLNRTCKASDIINGTNGACYQVSRLKGGNWKSPLVYENGRIRGFDFTFPINEGVLVVCSQQVNWKANCSPTATTLSETEQMFSGPIQEDDDIDSYPINLSGDPPALDYLTTENESGSVNLFYETTVDDSTFQNILTEPLYADLNLKTIEEVEAINAVNSGDCSIENLPVTNVTESGFTVMWKTTKPCPGSVVFWRTGEAGIRAYDDRGIDFSGRTHHVTISGLSPETYYNFQIYSASLVSERKVARTGPVLNQTQARTFISGGITAYDGDPSQNTLCYAILHNPSGYSAPFSFVMHKYSRLFKISIDSTRTSDKTRYFDLDTIDRMAMNCYQGYSGNFAKGWAVTPGTQDINLGMIYLQSIPDAPVAIYPRGSITTLNPRFRLYAPESPTNIVRFRIEISTNNFQTIAYVFDQSLDWRNGWSAPYYTVGQYASFQLPFSLYEGVTYHWRAFVIDDLATYRWGNPSDTIGFSKMPTQ